jgi:hypothetical protein
VTHEPSRAAPRGAALDPAKAAERFRATFGAMPPPTADMDAASEVEEGDRRQEAVVAFERSILPVYRWARFEVAELRARVGAWADRAQARALWSMRMPLALLDDLGNERDTAMNALPDVVFARHAEERPLWVTTGLSRPQLVARYGAGIVGRLFERASLVQLGGARGRRDGERTRERHLRITNRKLS